jgi:hypothetical protein
MIILRKIVLAGICVSVVIVVLVGITAMSFYALTQLQLSPRSVGNFDFKTLSLDVQLDACNPTSYPASFDEVILVLYYQSEEFLTVNLKGDTIMPNKAVTLNGKLDISDQLDYWKVYNIFSSFNESDLSLDATVVTNIVGVVPFSQTKHFDYTDFRALLLSPSVTQYSCT